MAILVRESKVHWNYFLALESDVVRLARFIEFREDNFPTYSIEIARLIMAAAAEVDVVAKLVCKKLDPTSRPRNINGYASVILPAAGPKLSALTILVPRYGLTLSLTIYHYALEHRYREHPLASDGGRKSLLARLQPQAQLFQLRTVTGDIAESFGNMDTQ